VKYVDEYRGEEDAGKFLEAIRRTLTRPRTVMEVCGGQTHTLIKAGIDQMLPDEVTVVHGPGCPVCVTPIELIDRAIDIAERPGVIFTSFGDMLRVPGSRSDLLSAKAKGADVRMVYSPLDAVELAEANREAGRRGLENFSILCSHVLVPPAMEAILRSPGSRVEGFLAAGHVCTVMGYREYEPIAEKYRVPIVVTGFEPLDLLQGLYMTIRALEQGRWGVENQYTRVVRRDGNEPARELIGRVFERCDRRWRGIGTIAASGYRLAPEFAKFDAETRFEPTELPAQESLRCIAGEILTGLKKPSQCSEFGDRCTPEQPLGAPMVSSEGACAAYYRYGRRT
jgi:hydrogenase expression/formation protein HypD